MPGGILTLSSASLRTRPWPLHVLQGSSTISPSPPQRGQVWDIAKKPWETCTRPEPRHCVQRLTPVPGLPPEPWHVSHVSTRWKLMGSCVPLNASRSEEH